MAFLGGSVVKRICLPVQQMKEMWVRTLGWEDVPEEKIATILI